MSTRFIDAMSGAVDAVIRVPGSKSVANRAIVCAALADGVSRLGNVPDGDDTARMLQAIATMGVNVDVSNDSVSVHGGDLGDFDCIVDAGLAGTTSRFLVALAVLRQAATTVVGDEALSRRPIGDLLDALSDLGADVTSLAARSLPVTVHPSQVSGSRVSIRGDVSSQFISALMLVAPRFPNGLTINISSPLVSRPYVAMTASVMSKFGVNVVHMGNEIVVPASEYNPCMYEVEPDYSSAAFPIMATAIRGGRVRIPGLANASEQGDQLVLDIARRMGCDVGVDDGAVEVSRDSSGSITPVTIDLGEASDLVPAVAVAAAFASGPSHLTGIGFIRNKESDRLGDLAAEMSKLGAAVRVLDDGLEIAGNTVWRGATVDTHHDHRLAMALSLASLGGVRIGIDDPDVVSKSWPTYWSDMSAIFVG